ncbi:MAG: transcriptional repressor [Muribaculaceae bacterium]|nr:transcriptional repressor [Muribaculaceae bacterium]
MKEIEAVLQRAGIAATPVRMLIYRCLKEASLPLSLSDIETALDSVDKSTVSRTLATFKNNHLIHSFTDGSGSTKYELCYSSPEDEEGGIHHVHFRCEKCNQTICLNDVRVPRVILPPGYTLREVNYVVTGICGACNDSIR